MTVMAETRNWIWRGPITELSKDDIINVLDSASLSLDYGYKLDDFHCDEIHIKISIHVGKSLILFKDWIEGIRL